MSQKLVSEILVPPNYARAFHVNSGQTLRIIAIEGPQTGNVAVFNAHNYRDVYDPYISYELNCIQGTGNSSRIRYLYSRPARVKPDVRGHRRPGGETLDHGRSAV